MNLKVYFILSLSSTGTFSPFISWHSFDFFVVASSELSAHLLNTTQHIQSQHILPDWFIYLGKHIAFSSHVHPLSP